MSVANMRNYVLPLDDQALGQVLPLNCKLFCNKQANETLPCGVL